MFKANMFLIEILLPLKDNSGNKFSGEIFAVCQKELTDKFGGLTAFTRTPADGLWVKDSKAIKRDEIAIFEVQAKDLDKNWWSSYRRQLEQRFSQDELVIRAYQFDLL